MIETEGQDNKVIKIYLSDKIALTNSTIFEKPVEIKQETVK